MSQKYKVYINNTLKIITHNWKIFCSNYKLINAAGGVVYNNQDQILMIFRNGKWDLPKGKLEKNETIEECAIREVKEECGIAQLEIIHNITDTYHTYILDGKNILKHTFWFKMKTNSNEKLIPQTQEGIIKAEWVSKDDIFENLKESYGNIRDILSNE